MNRYWHHGNSDLCRHCGCWGHVNELGVCRFCVIYPEAFTDLLARDLEKVEGTGFVDVSEYVDDFYEHDPLLGGERPGDGWWHDTDLRFGYGQ